MKHDYNPDQLYLFQELKLEPPVSTDTTILFYLPAETKQALVKAIKLQNLTIKWILNNLVSDYLEKLKDVVKPKVKTGRGNKVEDVENMAKELLRKKHPKTVRLVEIAKHCGVSQARAARIVDNLSGNVTDGEYDFLAYCEDDGSIGIFRDDKMGV